MCMFMAYMRLDAVPQNLGSPILQLAAGRFIPNDNRLALAVLHPRELTVCSIKAVGGEDG